MKLLLNFMECDIQKTQQHTPRYQTDNLWRAAAFYHQNIYTTVKKNKGYMESTMETLVFCHILSCWRGLGTNQKHVFWL